MNRVFLKNQYNGFRLNDTLASRLWFGGVIRVMEKSLVIRPLLGEKELEYWIIKDDYGARFGCFNLELADTLCVGEKFQISGEVKIGKGNIYLNLKEASPMNGAEFTTKE